jgi:hypothetical protein
MKSGQYVYVENPSHAKKVARTFGVTVEELKLAKLKRAIITPNSNFVNQLKQ